MPSKDDIDAIREQLQEKGTERLEDGEIGWTVEADYMFRLDDDQADARGARTGDVYRTTDPDLSMEYIGASFYLALEGGPTDMFEHEYGIFFEIIDGMPRTEIETDLDYLDPDPLYSDIEDVLEDYDLPLAFPDQDGEPEQYPAEP